MKALSFFSGPPIAPPNWFRLNGPFSTSKKFRASSALLRRYSNTSPCHWFVPEEVTTLTCPPLRFPYSAPYVCSRTLYSLTASTPSNCPLAPEGVMNWPVEFPPTQSTPLIRNRLFSWRWPATEKLGQPPAKFDVLFTTPTF